MKKNRVFIFFFIIVAIILLVFSIFFSNDNTNETVKSFEACKQSFEHIIKIVDVEIKKDEVKSFLYDGENMLYRGDETIYLDDENILNIKNFGKYKFDGIDIYDNQIVFLYGPGMEYVIYSENNEYVVDVGKNETFKCGLADNWNYIRVTRI